MNLSEYQLWTRSTVAYPGKSSQAYLVTALTGEIGETLNKVKKIIRDDDGIITTDRTNAIVLELGDCFWYIARMFDEAQMDMQKQIEDIGDEILDSLIPKDLEGMTIRLFMAVRESAQVGIEILVGLGLPDDIRLTSIAADLIAVLKFLNVTLESCLQINVDHLTLRQQNNVLYGDGDHRGEAIDNVNHQG